MKILFVCTGNTCRSPLAQAVFQHAADERGLDNISFDSAGIFCGYGEPMSANTKEIIDSMQIFFTHKSQPLTQKLADDSDIIITMTAEHKRILEDAIGRGKLYCIDEIAQKGDIADPYGRDKSAYSAVESQLKECVNAVFDFVEKLSADTDGSLD